MVQGEKAKDDIIEKIEYADSLGVDTIIVGRGSGSIEDLWNFNEEAVVRAIYNCRHRLYQQLVMKQTLH